MNRRVFRSELFDKDLVKLCEKEGRESIAQKLTTAESTLEMMEQGKIYPTGDEFRKVCEMLGKDPDEYFIEVDPDPPFSTLLKQLDEPDRSRVIEMKERIDIRNKYRWLSERAYRYRAQKEDK